MGVQINGSEGNVIATKGTFSGDVGIGGTLTYEDVTNIDSVGLVTARSGIEIGARPGVAASISVDGNMIISGISTFNGDILITSSNIDLADSSAGTNNRIKIGTDDDLQLWHNASTGNSNISNYNGDLYIQGNNGSGTAVNQIAVKSNAAVELNYQGTKKLETSSTGATVTGNLNCTALLPTGNLELVDSNAGNVGRIRMGAGDDFVLYHGGTDSHIENSTGQLKIASDTVRITNGTVSETQALFTANGAAELYYDNSKRLETTSSGVTISRSGDPIVTVTGSGHAQLQLITTSNSDHCGLNFGDSDDNNAGMIQYTNSSNYMVFHTNGQETMRMHSDKRISVNTTTKYGMIHSLEDQFNPDNEKWLTDASFVASGSFGGGYALLDGSKGYSMYCADNGNDFYIRHHSSTTAGGSGGVYLNNAATSWQGASDEREKENLVTISDAITKIKTLRTVTGNYTWQPDVRHAFLIAQDVQAVLPEAVSVMNKHAATEDQRLGLSYTEVIPLLVKAMQEQQEEIDALKAEIAALKSN